MLFIKFQNSRRLLLRRRQKDLDSSLGRACLRTRTQPPSRTRAATRHEAPPGRAGLPPHTSRLPAGTTLNWTAPGPPALHSRAQPGTGALGMGHGGSGPPGGVLRGCPPPTHPRAEPVGRRWRAQGACMLPAGSRDGLWAGRVQMVGVHTHTGSPRAARAGAHRVGDRPETASLLPQFP